MPNDEIDRSVYLDERYRELRAALEGNDGPAGIAVIEKMKADGYRRDAVILTTVLLEMARDAGYGVLQDHGVIRVVISPGVLSEMLSGAMDWRKCGDPGCEVCGSWPAPQSDRHEPGA